ncbi:hypothetical protein HYY75_13220, partial [bacterium]|nr:hypothetical protein [bacterium]
MPPNNTPILQNAKSGFFLKSSFFLVGLVLLVLPCFVVWKATQENAGFVRKRQEVEAEWQNRSALKLFNQQNLSKLLFDERFENLTKDISHRASVYPPTPLPEITNKAISFAGLITGFQAPVCGPTVNDLNLVAKKSLIALENEGFSLKNAGVMVLHHQWNPILLASQTSSFFSVAFSKGFHPSLNGFLNDLMAFFIKSFIGSGGPNEFEKLNRQIPVFLGITQTVWNIKDAYIGGCSQVVIAQKPCWFFWQRLMPP